MLTTTKVRSCLDWSGCAASLTCMPYADWHATQRVKVITLCHFKCYPYFIRDSSQSFQFVDVEIISPRHYLFYRPSLSYTASSRPSGFSCHIFCPQSIVRPLTGDAMFLWPSVATSCGSIQHLKFLLCEPSWIILAANVGGVRCVVFVIVVIKATFSKILALWLTCACRQLSNNVVPSCISGGRRVS